MIQINIPMPKNCAECPCSEYDEIMDEFSCNIVAELIRIGEEDARAKRHEKCPLKVENISEWLEDSNPGQEYGTTWACRKCWHSIHKPYIWNPYESKMNYCPHCGARMVVNMDAAD